MRLGCLDALFELQVDIEVHQLAGRVELVDRDRIVVVVPVGKGRMLGEFEDAVALVKRLR